ncbi:MAG: hypothetical protein AB7Q37_15335 [Pyrinomonadaceae bacterium]
MKNLKSIHCPIAKLWYWLVVSTAIFVFLLGSAAVSFGQGLVSSVPSSTELELFRGELAQTIKSINASFDRIRKNPVVADAAGNVGSLKYKPETSSAALAQLEKLSYEELEILRNALSTKFPKWRESAALMGRVSQRLSGKGPTLGNALDAPNLDIPTDCQSLVGVPSYVDYRDVKALEIGAYAAFVIIPPPLNVVLVGLWAPAAGVAVASETDNRIFDRCNVIEASKDVKVFISDLTDDRIIPGVAELFISALPTIIDNDNTNKDTILTAINTSAGTSQTAITGAVTNAQNSINSTVTNSKNEILTNSNDNTTAINSNVTNSKNEILTNSNNNTAAINSNVTNSKSEILTNSNDNTAAINSNVNNARTAIVANDNANTQNLAALLNDAVTQIINSGGATGTESKNLLLRTQIETALASSNEEIGTTALYATPASVCFPALNSLGQAQAGTSTSTTTQCGLLDLVRAIVSQTINNIGQPHSSRASIEFTLAETFRTQGLYKRAYVYYRNAYRIASEMEPVSTR